MADDLLISVVRYDDERGAREAATALVAAGIGAEVSHGGGAEGGDGAGAPSWVVAVLPDDVVRACAHLGIDPPDAELDDEEADGRPPWRAILLIWAVAMIVLPLAAFWLTVKLNT